MLIEIGSKAKDTTTGFWGVVTGHERGSDGKDRYQITPTASIFLETNSPRWIDAGQVELIEAPMPPKAVAVAGALRTDGPTLTEWLASGHTKDTYPPAGFAVREETKK